MIRSLAHIIARGGVHTPKVSANRVAARATLFNVRHFSATAGTSTVSTSNHSNSTASSTPAPLVAPAFGTNDDKDRRFVYIKGVKNDGRSKRFYAKVSIEPVQTVRGEEFGLTLDGRFIVTPYNEILSTPTRAAATGIAFEWDTQADFIRPASMPLTNICVTALDQAHTDRKRFLSHFRNAMQTDSVFLRVDGPSGLVSQQKKQWDPLLQWFRDRYGCQFRTTLEFETPEQDAKTLEIQQSLLESLSPWQLAALDSLTTVTKSFLISWALITDRLTIHQAFEAARLEENFQMRQYGQVEGIYGHGIEMEFTRMTLAAAKTWVNLVTIDREANPLLKPTKQ